MSEYSAASGGALKLKGSSGVDKKKKKKKHRPAGDAPEISTAADTSKDGESKNQRDLQKMLEEEDGDGADREEAIKEYEKYKLQGGKTEAERRYEERRRQRVSSFPCPVRLSDATMLKLESSWKSGCVVRASRRTRNAWKN
jgi:protein FAM32A